jgi:hypothetical protein
MDEQRGDSRRRLALDTIPEMARPVGLFGTQQRTEVGGAICFNAVVAMAMYAGLSPQTD